MVAIKAVLKFFDLGPVDRTTVIKILKKQSVGKGTYLP
jgi:hypothetical protein